MDPGDFEDLHPLLNVWTDFMNDASFNNPTTALPQQGLGIVGRLFFTDHLYLAGGVNDANGSPNEIDFSSFFETREYFTWAEVGWSPSRRAMNGDGIHFTAWHADDRKGAEVTKAGGSPSPRRTSGIAGTRSSAPGTPLAPTTMLTLGVGVDVRTDDRVGFAVTWGRPPQSLARDQFSVEGWFRAQFTDNVQLSPGFQWTLHPATNLDRNSIWIVSAIRVRVVF